MVSLFVAYTKLQMIAMGDVMKRSMGLWQLMGFAVTSLGGTLLHFYTNGWARRYGSPRFRG